KTAKNHIFSLLAKAVFAIDSGVLADWVNRAQVADAPPLGHTFDPVLGVGCDRALREHVPDLEEVVGAVFNPRLGTGRLFRRPSGLPKEHPARDALAPERATARALPSALGS